MTSIVLLIVESVCGVDPWADALTTGGAAGAGAGVAQWRRYRHENTYHPM
ncbi:MAG: hypothetical protein FWD11_00790 [Micrococcales bacterium]|nr:hypothetical protein [Micrococcales bacterium]